MIKKTKGSLLCVCSLGAFMMAGGTALADTAQPAAATTSGGESGVGVDEIIVTARQHGETLTSVPVAATALTASDLIRSATTDFSKVGELVPQVQISRTPSGNGGSAVIRGIGSSQQDAGVEQMVSFAFDGIQVSRGRAVVANMFDLRQIEVLKGPQALFFGKNAPAGVVALYSADPTSTLSGFVSAPYEFEAKEKRIEGAISGPLSSTLGARLAFRYSDLEGWIKNNVVPTATNAVTPFPGVGSQTRTFPNTEDVAGRLTLVWEPTTAFKATLKASYAHGTGAGEGGSRESWCAVPGRNNLVTSFGGAAYAEPNTDCRIDGNVAVADLNPTLAAGVPGFHGGRHYNEFDVYTGVLTAEYKDGPISVASTTGYLKVNSTGSYNYCMANALGFCFAYNGERYTAVSQQVRAISDFDSPINFTVGAYLDAVDRNQDSATLVNYLGIDPARGTYVNREVRFYNEQFSYSVFGQLRWNPMDNLELAGGARYTKEVKNTRFGNIYLHPRESAAARPANDFLSSRFSDDNVSPEVTLTWHPQPNTTLYGAYKTGFLSGGLSNPGTVQTFYTADNIRFKSARAKGGEIGAKGEFFGRRLRADLVIYQYDFSDLQVTQADTTIVPTTFVTKNAAKSRSRGIEGSVNWAVSPAFTLRGAIGYNDSVYLNYTGASCYRGQTAATGCITSGGVSTQTLSGQKLYRAPEISGNFGASYYLKLGGDLTFELTGDANYTSKYFTDGNNSPFSVQPAYWTFNASATLRSGAGWSLALIGRNLGNERYMINSLDRTFGVAGDISSVVSRPREINLQARFDF